MSGLPALLLRVRGLKTNFYTYQGVVKALDGIDLDMVKGQILGIVGETGCGKSVTALSILRLIPSPPGKVESGEALFDISESELAKLEGLRSEVLAISRSLGVWDGRENRPLEFPAVQRLETLISKRPLGPGQRKAVMEKIGTLREMLQRYDLLAKSEPQLRQIRGNSISMIFQEPMQALNPVFTIGDQIAESVLLHRPKRIYRKVVLRMRREDLRRRAIARLLDTFRGRSDLAAGVDLEDPTKADWVVLSGILSKESSGTPALLVSLRELVALDDELGEEAAKDSPYSRWLPKRFQFQIYMDLWGRSGWNASDVLTELQSVSPLGWSDVQTRDAFTISLTPGTGTAEDLRRRISDAMHFGKSPPSWVILGRILEPPSIDGGAVVLRVGKPFRAPSRNLILQVLSRIPALRRAVRHPMSRLALDEAAETLRLLSIPDPERVIRGYPHELSGGMQQRALTAIALSCDPLLLIADEPTTALDVTIQAQILELLRELKLHGRPSILLITHDLGVIAEMCDRVCVMYGGIVAEDAPVREIFKKPLHPYTQGLIKAIPSHAEKKDRLEVIRGSVPNLIYPPSGCRFHPRCPAAMPHCGWDAQDLETDIRQGLQELGLDPNSDVVFDASDTAKLTVGFPDGPEGERALALVRARVETGRESSPLLRAVRGITQDGHELTFALMKSRKPQRLEVEPSHFVSCYLYEPAPGGEVDA